MVDVQRMTQLVYGTNIKEENTIKTEDSMSIAIILGIIILSVVWIAYEMIWSAPFVDDDDNIIEKKKRK